MPVTVSVPVSTSVIEENPRCVRGGRFEEDAIVIELDARKQDHHATLGLRKGTRLHWSEEVRTYEVQELSSFRVPIRYRVTTQEAWYTDAEGPRLHYTPEIRGLDSRAKVSDVVKRAAVLLCVIGAVGYRRAVWLLLQLFQVSTSRSSLCRWIQEAAAGLPSQEEMVRLLDEKEAIA